MQEITKLSGEYNRGYTAALFKLKENIPGIIDDMKRLKIRFSRKSMEAMLDCMIKDRMELRDNPDAFVRCNLNVDGYFEVYSPKN